MKNMHSKQFLVLLMTLFALEKNAVCQKSPQTFDSAVDMWQNNSCIFPDKSLYKIGAGNVMPMLGQCRLIENRVTSPSPDDVFKAGLCQAFYRLSATLCDKPWQRFVQKCLNLEIFQKNNRFAEKGVCSYMYGNPNISTYFNFSPTHDPCQHNCEVGSMKPVCELYAFIIYQYEHQQMCSTSEKQDEKKDKIVEGSTQGKKQTSVTEESVTTPSTVSQTESTFTTQVKGLPAPLEQKHPEIVKSNETSKTPGNDIKSTSTVNGILQPIEVLKLKNDSKASDTKSTSTVNGTLQPVDTSAPKNKDSGAASIDISTSTVDETLPTEASAPKIDSKPPAPNKNELGIPPLLISKITSTITAEKVNTESTTSQEEEITTSTTQSTSPDEVKDDGNSEEDDVKGPPAGDDEQNEIEWDDDKPGVSKVKLPEELETGRKQSPNTLEKNIEKSDGNAYDDSESSPGSGHFLAYFLTAVVICISGYVIYHNKQKILAFIIEGRNGGRGGRQRSKDVKYSQLKSNVEEVMPSLEQTATGKNFVY